MSLRKTLGLTALLTTATLFGNIDNNSCNANPMYCGEREIEKYMESGGRNDSGQGAAGVIGLLFLAGVAGPAIAEYFKCMDYRNIGRDDN